MTDLDERTRVHIVGIGGSGLSGIARVLHGWGYLVTGSDQMPSAVIDALRAEGIVVHIGHRPENLLPPTGAVEVTPPLVVVSSAVPSGNPEVVTARRQGFEVIRRRELLGALTAGKTTIAVAGTHGKTTTTAMIAWILTEAGFSPSFVVGGILQNLGTNAKAGTGHLFAIEADEYDRAFLGLRPQVAVITSLEHDHPDCYPTIADMQDAFAEFATQACEQGQMVICAEDAGAVSLAERVCGRIHPLRACVGEAGSLESGKGSYTTYGLHAGCTWQAEDVQLNGCPVFRVRAEGRRLGQCALQLPGLHNVLNGLAAIAATNSVGVDFDSAAAALTRFRGTARRFEVKGQAGGVTVVDDYAHHPTAVRATLAAASSKYPGRELWVVFQPHTYSRTSALLDEFAGCFGEAHHVLVTGIYAAREKDTGQVSGADIVSRMRAMGVEAPDAHYVESLEGAAAWLLERIRPGAVVITLGAGDGYRVGELVLERLRSTSKPDSPASGQSQICRTTGGVKAVNRWQR
ncbi:MAG TPA: UDP-N-acetylmuramate--L-alanine ligase [Anaerolineae bacterium]|nr:UDP-N-acetylmuramate--L-alanine ligase [Anaerolineae bacterium]